MSVTDTCTYTICKLVSLSMYITASDGVSLCLCAICQMGSGITTNNTGKASSHGRVEIHMWVNLTAMKCMVTGCSHIPVVTSMVSNYSYVAKYESVLFV